MEICEEIIVFEGLLARELRLLLGHDASRARVRLANQELNSSEISELSASKLEKLNAITLPIRRLEWSEARRCEAALRKELAQADHCLSISLSHTRIGELPVVCAIAAHSPEPIGIDVELMTRSLSHEVTQRFTQLEELKLGLSPLELWVIKEALLKATPKNSGTTVSQYQVNAYNPITRQGSGGISSNPLRFVLVNCKPWVAALASP